MLIVDEQTFLSIQISFLCIVHLNMTPPVSNIDRNGPFVCQSEWKIKVIKIWWIVSD